MAEPNVVITNFGPVSVGPMFAACFKDLSADLSKSKRSNAFKAAKAREQALESAVMTLAQVHWRSGGLLEETP